jgi:hypothetical protein
MFSAYESYATSRKDIYHSTLKSIVRAKYLKPEDFKRFGFKSNGVSDKTQINNKMLTIQADLYPTNYTDTINNNGIKQVAKDWLADAQKKTKGWKPIGIVKVVNDIEQKSIGWRNDLVNYSTIREKGEEPEEAEGAQGAADFDYTLPFNDVKANFTALDKPTLLSIGLAVLAWLLMLFSWFITKRSTKVFRRIAPYEIEL